MFSKQLKLIRCSALTIFGGHNLPQRTSNVETTGADPRLSDLKLSSASSPPLWPRDDRNGWLSYERARNSRLAGSKALNSKGFSSVSVQNVHAIARLPHVDGTSDGQRPSAMSMLSAASKVSSPQTTSQSLHSVGSFGGPYPREAPGSSSGTDDVFRP
jgi:hypothetical protein